MTKIKSVFDWVKELSYDKEPWSTFSNEDHNLFSNCMVNKIVSMNPNYIELVAEIQEVQISKEKLYQFYCQTLPKQKFFNKYIKPSKAIYSSEVISILASFYQISTREVIDYCHIITKQDVIDILLQTGMQDKEIKKLLK